MNNIERALSVQGWMSHEELLWLDVHASMADTVLEIGSWKGRSTLALTACHGVLVAIDHWSGEFGNPAYVELLSRTPYEIYSDFKKNLAPEIETGKVVPEIGDRLEILARMKRAGRDKREFDMVFIDAQHDYLSVKQDIYAALGVLKTGGLLCGHDYAPTDPGVVRAVDELIPQRQIWKTIWSIKNGDEKPLKLPSR